MPRSIELDVEVVGSFDLDLEFLQATKVSCVDFFVFAKRRSAREFGDEAFDIRIEIDSLGLELTKQLLALLDEDRLELVRGRRCRLNAEHWHFFRDLLSDCVDLLQSDFAVCDKHAEVFLRSNFNGDFFATLDFLRLSCDCRHWNASDFVQLLDESVTESSVVIRVADLCAEILPPGAGRASQTVEFFRSGEWDFNWNVEAKGGVDEDFVV